MSGVRTSTASHTIFIEHGERVYPCRCGETHRGPYAHYDWAHHNCFHSSPLHEVDPEIPRWLICGDCGETFSVGASA